MSRVAKFAQLSRTDRRLVVEAGALVAVTRLALSLLPYPRVPTLMARLAARSRSRQDAIRSDRLAWGVALTSRYIPRATCLTQALALQALLSRHGRSGVVHFGVAKDDGALRAHAWLESEGRILVGGAEAARFNSLSVSGERG